MLICVCVRVAVKFFFEKLCRVPKTSSRAPLEDYAGNIAPERDITTYTTGECRIQNVTLPSFGMIFNYRVRLEGPG